MAKNKAKIRFTAETGEFTASIKQANSTLASLRAALALNEAEFKNTGDKAEYLKNKHEILEKELQANKEKQEALNKKLEAAKKIYGENSTEAQQWQNSLTKAKTEEQKLITTLNECEKEMSEMADATEEAGDAAQNSAKGGWSMAKSVLADLAKDALSAVINKLKEAAKEVIKLGTEFTASMSNVAALSGASAKELGNLEETAKELGRSTIFSAKDVADAFGYMSLAGWDTQQMMSGIDGVLNLAASSGMDLAKASDMVTDYLSAFGLEASDAAQMVDMLAYAQANSNTTTEQLGQAFGNSASQMHTAGQSMETTTAILEAFANQGMKGSEAGTALSAMVRDITQKMEDGKIMIGDTAITVQDANGNFRNMTDILADVEKATDGMGSAEKSAALMTTFTARSVKGVSMALTEGTDTIKDYEKQLDSCTGTAEDMTHVMNDNLAGDMKALGSATEGLGLALFEYFEGPLRGAAQLATDVINDITDAITPQKSVLDSFIDDIGASNDAVRASIENVQSTMSGLNSNIGELEAYKNIMLELNSKTELTEYEHFQLKDAVDKLSDTVPGLKDAYDETNGTLNVTNEELENMFKNAGKVAVQNAITKAQSEAMDALADATVAAAKASSAYDSALEAQKQSMEGTDESTVNLTADQRQAAQTLGEASRAQEDANKNLEDAKKEYDSLANALPEMLKQLGYTDDEIKAITESTEDATDATKGATEATGEYAMMTEEEIEAMEAQEKAAEELAKTIEESYTSMRDSIQKSMQDSVSFMEEFSGGAEVTAEDIQKNLQTQIDGISKWRDNMVRLSQEAGKGMSQEMYDALVEMGPSSANLVQELVETLENNTPQFEEICNQWATAMDLSNSADALANYTQAGQDYAEAIKSGLIDSSGEVEGAVKDVTQTASKEADFSDVGKEAKKTSADVKSGLNESVNVTQEQTALMKNAALSGAQQAKDALRYGLSGIPGEVQSVMGSAVSYINSGIAQMRAALSTTLRGPNIQVPHFSMTGEFDAKTKTVPTVHVNWWAKGGIFTQPTLIPALHGVGEAGAEAVLPIETLKDYISEAMEASPNQVNLYMTVNGADAPEDWADRFVEEATIALRRS